MTLSFESEGALCAAAAAAATGWRDSGVSPLLVGLNGDLGVGKTTWVRAMLGGLGHTGRVPSPTFTLLEHYEIGSLTVVHLDLYRLAAASEFEYLGLRDWLSLPEVCRLTILQAAEYFAELEQDSLRAAISVEVLKEIRARGEKV